MHPVGTYLKCTYAGPVLSSLGTDAAVQVLENPENWACHSNDGRYTSEQLRALFSKFDADDR